MTAEMPIWQVLLMHIPTMLTSLAGLVAACAAWRTASKGRTAAEASRATSERNEGALATLLNGKAREG